MTDLTKADLRYAIGRLEAAIAALNAAVDRLDDRDDTRLEQPLGDMAALGDRLYDTMRDLVDLRQHFTA